MKKTLLVLIAILLCIDINAQKSVKKLFNELKKDEATFGIKLPGWLINKAVSFVKDDKSVKDIEELTNIISRIKKVRVLVNSNNQLNFRPALMDFKAQSLKDNFESYASVRSKGSLVDVFVQQSDNLIENIIFAISAEGTTMLFQAETKIPLNEFEKLNFSFKKNKNIHENEN